MNSVRLVYQVVRTDNERIYTQKQYIAVKFMVHFMREFLPRHNVLMYILWITNEHIIHYTLCIKPLCMDDS
jgi:hypothetical protein